MIRITLLTLFVVLGTAGLQAQNAKTLREIKAFEQARYQAMLENDIPTLESCLSDDLVYTHSNCNLENKQEYLSKVGGGTYKFTQFETHDTRYRMLGKKQVVATGRALMAGNYKEFTFSLESRFTAIYIKEKGRWKLHTWQTTKCSSK